MGIVPHEKKESDKDCNEAFEPLWKVKDVSQYLRLSEDTVRNLARNQEIPAIKIGRSWRFKKEDILQIE